MMKRLLSKTTLLAFATSGLIVSGAAASPVIDPPDAPPPPQLSPTAGQPLMDGWYTAAIQLTARERAKSFNDGWYTAAIQQTRAERAKKHPKDRIVYRSSAPVSGHGPMLP
jgi:hypothetical protein